MGIGTIIFDWAGVFCSPGEPFAHPELARLTGLSVDEMGAKTKTLQDRYYCGTVTGEEFWRETQAILGTDLHYRELVAAYLASSTVDTDMLTLATALKQEYRTVLLSNLAKEMTDHVCKLYDLRNLFDHAFFSNEIGLMKPDPRAYELALTTAGTPKKEALFIDDSKNNVEAAQALGIGSILFHNREQLLQKLAQMRVTIPH